MMGNCHSPHRSQRTWDCRGGTWRNASGTIDHRWAVNVHPVSKFAVHAEYAAMTQSKEAAMQPTLRTHAVGVLMFFEPRGRLAHVVRVLA